MIDDDNMIINMYINFIYIIRKQKILDLNKIKYKLIWFLISDLDNNLLNLKWFYNIKGCYKQNSQ